MALACWKTPFVPASVGSDQVSAKALWVSWEQESEVSAFQPLEMVPFWVVECM